MKKILVKIFRKIKQWDESDRLDQLRKKYSLPKSFRFNGERIKIYGEGNCIVGEESYVGEGSSIQVAAGRKVIIGSKCQISHNVRIYTTSNDADQDFSSITPRKLKSGDVTIGDFVWIGANVFINPGITIGSNSVIGANSVVTKDVEPFSIYGGVPAKLLRKKQ